MFAPDVLETPFIRFHQVTAIFFFNGQRSSSVEKTGEVTSNYANKRGEALWWVIDNYGKVKRFK